MAADEIVRPDPAALLTAALEYAGRGWPVFPCLPGQKEPATPHGFKDGTTDPGVVRKWWRRWPTANPAIATGSPAVDALDVDVKPDGNGFAAYNRLVRSGMTAGAVALVRTRSGGLHVYFAGTAQPCGRLPRLHLDWKASGGYVLAAPSVVQGRAYVLVEERRGTGEHFSWEQAKRLLNPARPIVRTPIRTTTPRGAESLASWLSTAQEGNRNAALFWAACRLAEEGATATGFEAIVSAAVNIGLDEREARKTIKSAMKRAGRGAA